MRLLAIESSGLLGSIALANLAEGRADVVREAALTSGQRSAQSLAPIIAAALEAEGWEPKSLDVVAVTVGPGSFTGLRIGVTTAKTLAYAVGAKLVAVHTLAALARQVEGAADVWAVLDAQRGELFAARFSNPSSTVILPPTETLVLPAAEWLTRLEPGEQVIGPPAVKLAREFPPGAKLATGEQSPTARSVAAIAAVQFAAGEVSDLFQLVPNYYRLSAAEEKLVAKK